MTLLSICQAAADEAKVSRPATIIGNNNQTATSLLRYANRVGKDLVRENYPYLVKEHTFSTVASQNNYSLPSDFDHFVPFTQWNRSTFRRASAIDSAEWQALNSGLLTVSINDRYRIKGKGRELFIYPTPTSIETIAFEYVSKNFCQSAALAERSEWAADTDTATVDEELFELGVIWRMKNSIGLQYAEEKAEYQRVIATTRAQIAPMKIRTDGTQPTISNIPDTGFG